MKKDTIIVINFSFHVILAMILFNCYLCSFGFFRTWQLERMAQEDKLKLLLKDKTLPNEKREKFKKKLNKLKEDT